MRSSKSQHKKSSQLKQSIELQNVKVQADSKNVGNGQVDDELQLEIEYELRLKSPNISNKNGQCILCSTMFLVKQMVNLTQCQHSFCLDCSLQYIKEKIYNRKLLKCPFESCQAQFDKSSIITTYLTVEQIQNLDLYGVNAQKQAEQLEVIYIQDLQDQIKKQGQVKDITQQQKQRSVQIVVSQQKYEKKPETNQIIPYQKQQEKTQSAKNSQVQTKQNRSSVIGNSISSTNEIIHKKVEQLQMQREQAKNVSIQKSFPKKLFFLLCAQIWSNKCSKFFIMLPISIIVLSLYVLVVVCWSFYLTLYFVLVWLIFAPFVWAFYQIWGCFKRSFPNFWIRLIIFFLSLILFPIVQIFFFLVTLSLILYYKLYRLDMNLIVEGKLSLVLSLRKIYMHEKYTNNFQCRCRISSKCEYCQNKKSILCFVY